MTKCRLKRLHVTLISQLFTVGAKGKCSEYFRGVLLSVIFGAYLFILQKFWVCISSFLALQIMMTTARVKHRFIYRGSIFSERRMLICESRTDLDIRTQLSLFCLNMWVFRTCNRSDRDYEHSLIFEVKATTISHTFCIYSNIIRLHISCQIS